MIIYKACISIALPQALRSQDTNLMITILFIATLCVDKIFAKRRKVGVKKNGELSHIYKTFNQGTIDEKITFRF